MSRKIYLAGPEVFLPEAVAVGGRKKALCAAYGFEGLYPFDNDPTPRPGEAADRAIYRMNVAMIALADAVIANLTPFRGPSADVGTVFELGMAAGLGKMVFGYTNRGDDLIDRVREIDDVRPFGGGWRDGAGLTVEDYGNADNLMIDCSLSSAGHPIVRPQRGESFELDDLRGFELCLRMIRAIDGSDRSGKAAE